MANGVAPISSTLDPVIQITIPVSIKLDWTNFLSWRSQIETIIDGFALSSYLDSSAIIPDKQIQAGAQWIDNPIFLAWHK